MSVALLLLLLSCSNLALAQDESEREKSEEAALSPSTNGSLSPPHFLANPALGSSTSASKAAPVGGELPVRPSPFRVESREHRFWDGKNKLLYSAAAAAAAADFWTTRRAISRGAREMNPIARPFAGNDAAFAAYKAGNWGTYLALGYVCHRQRWHRLERILPLISISFDGTAAGLNIRKPF